MENRSCIHKKILLVQHVNLIYKKGQLLLLFQPEIIREVITATDRCYKAKVSFENFFLFDIPNSGLVQEVPIVKC